MRLDEGGLNLNLPESELGFRTGGLQALVLQQGSEPIGISMENAPKDM